LKRLFIFILLIKLLDVSGMVNWPEGTEAFKENKLVMPGDNVEMTCELHHPLALEKGQRFNVREGGRTVATGLVTQVLE
jgi:elongation factor Tu